MGRPLAGENVVEFSDASIRSVQEEDGRGDGLAAVDLVASDRSRVGETLELGEMRFNFV